VNDDEALAPRRRDRENTSRTRHSLDEVRAQFVGEVWA